MQCKVKNVTMGTLCVKDRALKSKEVIKTDFDVSVQAAVARGHLKLLEVCPHKEKEKKVEEK